MKTKRYRNGTFSCKGWMRNVGNGFEVGFHFGSKPIFLSNFVRANEANAWYTMMNREVRAFARRYQVAPRFPKAMYGRFLSSHLYAKYFSFLDRLFTKHTRTYSRAVSRDLRSFRRMYNRTAGNGPRKAFLRAA